VSGATHQVRPSSLFWLLWGCVTSTIRQASASLGMSCRADYQVLLFSGRRDGAGRCATAGRPGLEISCPGQHAGAGHRVVHLETIIGRKKLTYRITWVGRRVDSTLVLDLAENVSVMAVSDLTRC